MNRQTRAADLEAYLDEALSVAEMSQLEQALRDDPELLRTLSEINARRDAGLHTLGEIWRRHRVTCPTREELGSFLLRALPQEVSDYVAFHLETVGCRYCEASLADLRDRHTEQQTHVVARRKRYFETSAGHLRPH